MTAPDIDGKGPMYVADFRDMNVLIYRPTGHFIGLSMRHGLCLCKGPLKLVDGVWVASPDEDAIRRHPEVGLTADLLDFRPV